MSDVLLHERAFRMWAAKVRQSEIARELDISESMISRWRTGSCSCDCPFHGWDRLVEPGELQKLDHGIHRPEGWQIGKSKEAPVLRPKDAEEVSIEGERVLKTSEGFALPAESLEGIGPGKDEGTGAPDDAPVAEMFLENVRSMARWLTWTTVKTPDGKVYRMPKVEPQSAKEAAAVAKDAMILREAWLRHQAITGSKEEEKAKPVEERVGELSDEDIARELRLLQGGKTATG